MATYIPPEVARVLADGDPITYDAVLETERIAYVCLTFLDMLTRTQNAKYHGYNGAYGLKHVVERLIGEYVPEGAVLLAAHRLGMPFGLTAKALPIRKDEARYVTYASHGSLRAGYGQMTKPAGYDAWMARWAHRDNTMRSALAAQGARVLSDDGDRIVYEVAE